jgi:hypothetical protein
MPHVKRASDVRRRYHDRKGGFCGIIIGLKITLLCPERVPFLLYLGWYIFIQFVASGIDQKTVFYTHKIICILPYNLSFLPGFVKIFNEQTKIKNRTLHTVHAVRAGVFGCAGVTTLLCVNQETSSLHLQAFLCESPRSKA